MTDASQEGERRSTDLQGTLLVDQVIASWDEKLTRPWDGAVDRWQAQRAIRTVENYYRSKGVPIDALEHGRMQAITDPGQAAKAFFYSNGYVIVPDSATEGDGE